jgi:hypothetical protein
MSIHTIHPAIRLAEASSFRARYILWTLGMCAVSLSLTPVVAFYVLLVA